MKKRFIALIIAGAMILTMIPAMLAFADESAGEAPDYSKTECWYKIPEITKDVDTFFVYPTEYMASNEGDPDYAPLDNAEMLEGVKTNYPILASVYEDSTNVFMPYYRQAGMMFAAEEAKKSGDPRTAFATIPYADITAALDYYFENYNNGRPFIIAGHSQGSAIVSLVLKNYFKEHRDYYDRMIAAYVIGFSITKEYLEENTHLKFAAGESDTGVIISWNTEGPKNVEQNARNVVLLPNAISINPLNWKLDETYAPASENLGSRVLNEKTGEYEMKDIGADAKVILDRGSVLTNADTEPVEGDTFGPQSYHNGDYALFYNNIKDNVAKRIAAYQASDDANSFDEIIKNISESGYDINGLFGQIADLVEILLNDGETETAGNIIHGVGHLIDTIINGDDTSSASSELIGNLIQDEESLSQLSSGTVLDIYETSRDDLIRRGYVPAWQEATMNQVFDTKQSIKASPVLLSDYWTEGSEAAESLNEYLTSITDETSPDYIPEEDRIAVFDLDGTLMCETFPFCFEYMVFADYALNSGNLAITDDIKAVAKEIEDAAGGKKPDGMSTRQAAAGAAAYQGMTMEELAKMVDSFKDSEAWGFSGMTRGEAFYKPMVELFEKLQENDFTVYVVTATERNIVRALIKDKLNIPPSHVIGTEYGYTATAQGDEADADYTFQSTDQIVFDGNYYGENAKTSKVDAIVREIGQQPVLAFGNSSGDLAMEIYTISNNPYKSAAYMVVADDAEREYGNADSAEEKKTSYKDMGIGIISMRDDFKTIYGDNVTKVDEQKNDKENAA